MRTEGLYIIQAYTLVMARVVSRQSLNPGKQVPSQANTRAISGGHSDTVTGFPSNTSVFSCQYHSTIAPYSFIHLPPTLYNVFLPVLHFPLSVPFHRCSTLVTSGPSPMVHQTPHRHLPYSDSNRQNGTSTLIGVTQRTKKEMRQIHRR